MTLRTMALGVAFVWLSLGALAQEVGWTTIGRQDGFVISRREGDGLPAFRGVGPIHANVEDVLAVLRDVRSINQWAFGISRSELIERLSPDVELIYLFSITPAPFRDRDMTLRREIRQLQSGNEYHIVLRCEPGLRPLVPGVVRVVDCHSEFRLRRLNDQETEVEYWAWLDPAGHIPKWANSWMVRTVPARTLSALESRVLNVQRHRPAASQPSR